MQLHTIAGVCSDSPSIFIPRNSLFKESEKKEECVATPIIFEKEAGYDSYPLLDVAATMHIPLLT